jgi:predicted O-methyltransferase YrrM
MTQDMYGPEDFHRFLPGDGGFLDALERRSVEEGIPIVGSAVAGLLSVLIKAIDGHRILELGTANGFSSIYMALALPEGGRVTTLEWSQDLADEARSNFRQMGVADRVDIMVGDALELIKQMGDGIFDMVFIDIEKEMYTAALEDCVRVLRMGGVLVSDNVAFRSSGDYNQRLHEHPDLDTSFVYGTFHNHSPEEDAISISVKIDGR